MDTCFSCFKQYFAKGQHFTYDLDDIARYYKDYVKYGLDDPRTYRSKYALRGAVKKFERSTGIDWPFK